MFFAKKKSGLCSFCEWLDMLLAALAVVCTLAAVIGLYKAHVLSSGLTFGTTSGSMSLIAVVISMLFLKKACDKCMCSCKIK